MPVQIHPLRFGINRCYLVQDKGIIMIDGGPTNKLKTFQKLIKHLHINPNDIRDRRSMDFETSEENAVIEVKQIEDGNIGNQGQV